MNRRRPSGRILTAMILVISRDMLRVGACMVGLMALEVVAMPYIGKAASWILYGLGPVLVVMALTWHRRLQKQTEAMAEGERHARERLERTLKRLESVENRARRFIDQNLVGMITCLPSGRILEANPAFLKMVGYTQEDVCSGSFYWTAMTPPEWQPADADAMVQLTQNGQAEPFEKEYFRKNGTRVSVLVCPVSVERSPDIIACFILDLTETKKSYAAMASSERRFRQLMDAIPQIVFLVSEDDSETFVSNHWLQTFGNEPSVPVLRHLAWILEEDRAQAAAAWNRAIADDQALMPFEFECRILRADGVVRWQLTKVVPTINSIGRPAWIGLIMDIHDQKTHAEQLAISQDELLKAKDAAEAANRSKNQFIANISHELRTPLSAILGFSELIRQSQRSVAGEHRDFLERISRNTEVLARLIDEILDLAKVEAQRLEISRSTFDICALVTEIEELARLRARSKDLVVRTRWMTEVPQFLTSDPLRVRQILSNVIGNAVKFTDSGCVEIHVFAYELSDEDFRWRLRIDVIDTGIGVSIPERKRLFYPFNQGDHAATERFGGSGLGLALSRRLARALGGDLILAESEPNKGSRFILTIDGGSRDEVLTPQTNTVLVAEPSPLALTGLHILTVDDSADSRLLVERVLTSHGALVETAENGRQAIAKTYTQTFDLILLDIQMPYLDGFETIEELRQNGYAGPVIALTALSMQGERDRCLVSGFSDYLAKPVSYATLVTTILRRTNARSEPQPLIVKPSPPLLEPEATM
jgi:PAS domain S-box-containing protein